MFESNTQYCLSRVHGWWVRPFARMKYAAASSALLVLAALTLQSTPTVAQEQAGTQSVEIFGGDSNQHLNTSETTLGIGWRF